MIPEIKTTRTNFIYSSGTVRIEKENIYTNERLVHVDTRFVGRKELRKILFLYKDSGLVVTVMFDEPKCEQ